MSTMPMITFRLPSDLVEAIDQEARRRGRNRSELVRETLEAEFGFGAKPVDAGNGDRDQDQATPPDISDALAQMKSNDRTRRYGQITTSTGPARDDRAEEQRRALMRARLEKR